MLWGKHSSFVCKFSDHFLLPVGVWKLSKACQWTLESVHHMVVNTIPFICSLTHSFHFSFYPSKILTSSPGCQAQAAGVGSAHSPASQSDHLSNVCLALLTLHLCLNPRHFSQLSWNVSYSINESCHYSDLCQFPAFTRYLAYGIPQQQQRGSFIILPETCAPPPGQCSSLESFLHSIRLGKYMKLCSSRKY